MIIYKCDICSKEITDLNELGNFKIQEKVVDWLKHQKQQGVKVREYILCIECARKITEHIVALRKGYGGDTK